MDVQGDGALLPKLTRHDWNVAFLRMPGGSRKLNPWFSLLVCKSLILKCLYINPWYFTLRVLSPIMLGGVNKCLCGA